MDKINSLGLMNEFRVSGPNDKFSSFNNQVQYPNTHTELSSYYALPQDPSQQVQWNQSLLTPQFPQQSHLQALYLHHPYSYRQYQSSQMEFPQQYASYQQPQTAESEPHTMLYHQPTLPHGQNTAIGSAQQGYIDPSTVLGIGQRRAAAMLRIQHRSYNQQI